MCVSPDTCACNPAVTAPTTCAPLAPQASRGGRRRRGGQPGPGRVRPRGDRAGRRDQPLQAPCRHRVWHVPALWHQDAHLLRGGPCLCVCGGGVVRMREHATGVVRLRGEGWLRADRNAGCLGHPAPRTSTMPVFGQAHGGVGVASTHCRALSSTGVDGGEGRCCVLSLCLWRFSDNCQQPSPAVTSTQAIGSLNQVAWSLNGRGGPRAQHTGSGELV